MSGKGWCVNWDASHVCPDVTRIGDLRSGFARGGDTGAIKGIVGLSGCFSPTPARHQSSGWRPTVKPHARWGHRREQGSRSRRNRAAPWAASLRSDFAPGLPARACSAGVSRKAGAVRVSLGNNIKFGNAGNRQFFTDILSRILRINRKRAL